MFAQRLQRWPDIETAMGDFPVFAWTAICGWRFAPPVRKATTQKSHYPYNTIHWPNGDVMLGYRLWRWANIISALSL